MVSSRRGLEFAFFGGLAVSGAMGANCDPQSVFACSSDDDCLDQGEGGRCESGNVCTFPDEACETGRRWHDRAPIPDAGLCWMPEGETEGERDGDTTGGTSTGVEESGPTSANEETG
jgi:hypothetical protein